MRSRSYCPEWLSALSAISHCFCCFFLCCFDLLSAISHCSSQISSLSHRTTNAYADSYSQRHCRFRLVVGDTIFNQYLCGSHRSIFQCPPPLLLRKVTQVQHLGATDNAKLIRVAHCSIQVGKFSGSPFVYRFSFTVFRLPFFVFIFRFPFSVYYFRSLLSFVIFVRYFVLRGVVCVEFSGYKFADSEFRF